MSTTKRTSRQRYIMKKKDVLSNVMKGELDIGMEMQIQTLSKEFVVWLNWGCELKNVVCNVDVKEWDRLGETKECNGNADE